MPNTPAAVGQGISALIGNVNATEDHLALAQRLMASVGQVVHLDTEAQMDAVTGVSGSGPAYVFHLIETLAAAGITEGLPRDLAFQLASATVAGAGALAQSCAEFHPLQSAHPVLGHANASSGQPPSAGMAMRTVHATSLKKARLSTAGLQVVAPALLTRQRIEGNE